jgi:DAK2 domain fusion protein YloV
MYKALKGEYIHVNGDAPQTTVSLKHNFNADSELTYGYCTEFILQLQNSKVADIENFDVQPMIDYLLSIGDSAVCVRDEDIVKIHVHTRTPGEVLNFGQKFGEFITIKIENMQVQHTESTEIEQCNCEECVEARKKAEHKKWAVIMVASGDGLVNTFKEMGVDYVVSGGQTMNPSAEDFVKGFDELNADNILVFPNNSNIIMAAEQAAKYYGKANVHVVKTKSIAQGYAALAMLDVSSDDINVILEETNEVISNVTTGLVTYAIRDAEIDDVVIHNGDFMGLCNSKIKCAEATKVGATKSLIDLTDAKDKEIITIIYGKDVTEDELNAVVEYINENYDNLEVETIDGGQEVYSFILSIE